LVSQTRSYSDRSTFGPEDALSSDVQSFMRYSETLDVFSDRRKLFEATWRYLGMITRLALHLSHERPESAISTTLPSFIRRIFLQIRQKQNHLA
jgi:hypothetical protein